MTRADKSAPATRANVATRDGRGNGWWKRRRVAILAALAGAMVRLLGATWRLRVEGREQWDEIRAGGSPVVLAIWHGEILPLLWAHRREPISILVSTHSDGEIIARVLESLGFSTVRGSSSRGGARALIEMVSVLRSGRDVAITPDGPRGPRRVFAPGAAVAAMRAGAPVVAIGARVERAWWIRSWDRLMIPKPFARVVVRYATPVWVQATSARDAEAEAPRLGAAINSVAMPDGA